MNNETKKEIGELLGEATMCWDPVPVGVFQSDRASEILNKIYAFIEAECERKACEVFVEERAFLMNILDGIDIADKSVNNRGGGTEAVRLLLKTRVNPYKL